MADNDMGHMSHLETVQRRDNAMLITKESTYKGSWKRRGGVGAFMMLARKWDRLEAMCQEKGYNIFDAVGGDMSGEDGTTIAEIRDLRCYLTLVEAEMVARAIKKAIDEAPNGGVGPTDSETRQMRAHMEMPRKVVGDARGYDGEG